MAATTGIFAVVAVALMAGAVDALPPQKIFGGSAATLGEFPYQIALRLNGKHHCGGSIVSNRHIITAAHCVAGVSAHSLQVATGSIALTGGQTHTVSKIDSHPFYNSATPSSNYDIAVLTLSAPITFNSNQNKIDLASTEVPVGASAIATGWGVTSAQNPKLSQTLLKTTVRIMSDLQCQSMLSRSVIYENQICTYSPPGVGTCQGDSGGPLAYNGKLIGVVSYGIPCALGMPDVFTKIAFDLEWINKKIGVAAPRYG